jgi:predicted nucleic acid-binding protein
MNNSSRVVLDACVLVPIQLCDTLLRVADAGMFQPVWSNEILEETERTLVNVLGLGTDKAARRVNRMREAFPLATIDEFHDLIPQLTNDQKDRHVLAAAIKSGADTILTANLKDFPPHALEKWRVRALHPDQFLDTLLNENPSVIADCLQQQRGDYKKPAYTSTQFYDSLAKTVPIFARRASDAETRLRTATPQAFEIAPEEAAVAAFFANGTIDDSTPLGAGFLWNHALLNLKTHRDVLDHLSYNPDDWGDYAEVAADLANYALAQHVRECGDAPGQIAYLLLVPDTGHAMRAFANVELTDYYAITLVRADVNPEKWRVWGVSQNDFPSAKRVKYGID